MNAAVDLGNETVTVTYFRDYAAKTKREARTDLHALAELIGRTTAPAKAPLPWLKLARFGDVRTSAGSLRHNTNLQALTGVEADYDGEIMPVPFAASLLRCAGVQSIVYTSPSHTDEKPRWRVLCPASIALPPDQRDRLLDRLNGALGGVLAPESWVLSQSYYFGSVNANPSHRVEIIDGTPIDLLSGLDAGALAGGRQQSPDRRLGHSVSPATEPISEKRYEGFRVKVVDTLCREAVDGAKHHALLRHARTLGGIQVAAGFSDETAVQWLLDALPDTVEDWDIAARTARDGLAYGRAKPIQLEDRPLANGHDTCRPFPITAAAEGAAVDEETPRGSKRRRVRGEIDADVAAGKHGPIIQARAGELHKTTTEAEKALIASGVPIYQRGEQLVQPIIREVAASRGRTTLAAGLGELTVHSTVDLMCATAEYKKYDARAKDWIRINPPTQIAQTLLSRKGKWQFPSIAGIVTTPTLRPDGTLLLEHGYDPATRLYHVKDETLNLQLPINPTKEDAEKALRLLKSLLTEFPFVGPLDRAVALSGIITPVVRGAITVAPLHAMKATAAGTGKSFLIDVISTITTGRPCPVASAAANDPAETEKRVVGNLLAGYPILTIDNCNGELGGDLLCQAVERPLLRIRALGASDIYEIENRTTIYATGNALRVRGDLVRRALILLLDAGLERPELRQFRGNPVAEIEASRGWYVSACLTIAMAYQAAGLPGRLPPLASFEDWSDTVRSALVWLGESDPCTSMEQAREDDPELSTLREMLGLWQSAIGVGLEYAQTVREVAEKASARAHTVVGESTDFLCPDFRDAILRLAGVGGAVNTRRLGIWLANNEGRIVGGVKFRKHPKLDRTGVARWAAVKG